MTYDGREPGAGPESVESSPRGQPLGERPTPPPGVRVMRAIRWGMFAALAALALVSMGGYLGTWTDRGHPGGRARFDRGVRERGDDCAADEGMRRLSRLRPALIGRLSYPVDGGIRVHDFTRQRVERDGSGC